MQRVFILNTTICTTPGLIYRTQAIDVAAARRYVAAIPNRQVISAVGHESTAAIASSLLEVEVPVSRITAAMQAGDFAVCLKLRGRPPEGAVLSAAEVEAIGYDFVLMEVSDPATWAEAFRRRDICLDLLSLPDDPDPTAKEQPPGTRRRGSWPEQVHYVVRRPRALGGGTVDVFQESGTDAWYARDRGSNDA